MAEKKLENTEFKKVIITYKDPENETPIVKIGGNDVVVNGKRVLKQYTARVEQEVELPVTFIEKLKNRFEMKKRKNGVEYRSKILNVEEV
jgi:hypothetical protein